MWVKEAESEPSDSAFLVVIPFLMTHKGDGCARISFFIAYSGQLYGGERWTAFVKELFSPISGASNNRMHLF